ncbi:aldo/keto reductase [Leptospira ilyithenensis]|uniref:Aldo/keto reductase n=2 Tax=Leptospira ilyithenensis TaxID=2484901 RepID=A0A4V6QMU1_9LEPT|nr:aldo/keto reductase [Leptospira ilyithenensis]
MEAQSNPSLKNTKVLKAKILSSGEFLPRVGLGTYQTFDVGKDSSKQKELSLLLEYFYSSGGSMIDSSPMYGTSEEVVGDVSLKTNLNEKLFFATKVWISGKEAGEKQMLSSLSKMKRKHLELMQIHNLVDWKTHLITLKDWKEKGIIRYIGITHYTTSAFPELEKIIRSEQIDFLQIPYSIAETTGDERLIPAAFDHGVSVIANEPFARGRLFSSTKGKDLPGWAKEIGISSWAEYFLKFILASEKIQFVIPATNKLGHLKENMTAGTGNLPSLSDRKKMKSEFF